MIASDQACTRLPLQNLHGKEGVSGSSPEEGFGKPLQAGRFCFTHYLQRFQLDQLWSTFWNTQTLASTRNSSKAPWFTRDLASSSGSVGGFSARVSLLHPPQVR